MKSVPIYACFFLFILCAAGKGQTGIHLPTAGEIGVSTDVITSYGPNSITRNIIQDKNGNIWAATWQGVFRYDGKSFANITSKVVSARFFSALEDRKGKLWFGSIGSGVYYYDGRSFRNFTTKDGLVNNEVTCIYEDKSGNIWFGVNGGVSHYDGKSFTNYLMSGDVMIEDRTGKSFPDFTRPPNEVNSIVEDKTGNIWLGTRGNTFVYDGKTFTVFTNNGKPFNNVRSITEDKNGNIWLGGANGLWRYSKSNFTHFTSDFVGYVYEDKKGNIWTSSETVLGWVLSRYARKSVSDKMPAPTVINPKEGKMLFGIVEARDGSIWYGSDGLYRYDGTNITGFKDKAVQE